MKFNAIVGNPPYQVVTAKHQSETNGQSCVKSIFHYFQIISDEISSGVVSLIYPGKRWIHRSGKGMENFGLAQINDPQLVKIDFYPEVEKIFEKVSIADGISIVLKNKTKKNSGFQYVFHPSTSDPISVILEAPGEKLIDLDPRDTQISVKVVKFVQDRKLDYIPRRILLSKLFGIESDFVEKNPDKVRPYQEGEELQADEIKLFTNDRAGKAGRSTWYIASRDIILVNSKYINEWQVVVSSANAGGQKRDNQIEIIDNRSAFGRSRVALASFKTREEAENFYNFSKAKLIRFMYLLTDEALTSLGKKVPDLNDYSCNNGIIDFSKDIDEQLFHLMKLDENEIAYIKSRV